MYVPAGQDDIALVDWVDDDGNVIATADDDPYLSDNRGQYAEKNSNFAPWESILDLAIRQDIGVEVGGSTHRLQLSLDIFNFANLINKDWGVRYRVPGSFSYYELLSFEEFDEESLTPTYTYRGDNEWKDSFNIDDFTSRWRMRLGVRYIFN